MRMRMLTIYSPMHCCSGLKTQFGLINDGEAVGFTVLLIVVALVSKVAGILAPTIFFKIPIHLSSVMAILMTCKGCEGARRVIAIVGGVEHEARTQVCIRA